MNRQLMDSLAARIAEHAAHLDAATHRLLTDLREFDQGGGWYQQGARSCAQWLSWRVGWDRATAREHVRIANRLAELPHIDEALRRGEMSYSKVRAMTRVATRENEAMLLEEARLTTAIQLETICRKYAAVQRHDKEAPKPRDDEERRYVTRRDTEDGMVRIEAVLHPEEAVIVWAALDRVAAERCRAIENEGPSKPTAPGDGALTQARRVSAETPCVNDNHELRLDTASGAGGMRQTGGLDAASRKAAARASSFDRADALVSMAQDIVRGSRKNRSPIDVMVTMDADTLRRDDVAHQALLAKMDSTDRATRELSRQHSGRSLRDRLLRRWNLRLGRGGEAARLRLWADRSHRG
jgi:hypothetical protein